MKTRLGATVKSILYLLIPLCIFTFKSSFASIQVAAPNSIAQNEIFEITIEKPVDYGAQENIKDVDLLIDFIDPVSGKATKLEMGI